MVVLIEAEAQNPVTSNGEPFVFQRLAPLVAAAEVGWVAEESVLLFLGGEAGKLVAAGVVGRDQGPLAVEDGRAGVVSEVAVLDVETTEVGPDRGGEGRVRIAVEIGVGQVGDLGSLRLSLLCWRRPRCQ